MTPMNQTKDMGVTETEKAGCVEYAKEGVGGGGLCSQLHLECLTHFTTRQGFSGIFFLPCLINLRSLPSPQFEKRFMMNWISYFIKQALTA